MTTEEETQKLGTCAVCRYCKKIKGDYVCRRCAPRPGFITDFRKECRFLWPPVPGDWWCGEFAPCQDTSDRHG